MNPVVNLVDRLLIKGRALRKLGLDAEALGVFRRLARFRHLPSHVVEETHARLANLCRVQGKYRLAQRHLATLLTRAPDRAALHRHMGQVLAADPKRDPQRAARHFRRALHLDPKDSRNWIAYAKWCCDNGREQSALKAFRQAYTLAPDDAFVLRGYLRTLRLLHRFREGQRVLRECRFRLGHHGWFVKLRDELLMAMLRARQLGQRRAKQPSVHSEAACLLSFPVVEAREAKQENFEHVREDRPSILPAPHLRMRLHRPDQRHAQ